MKIGIITFHWAPNCGAVLQAYALQTYLQKLGNSVEIIDYRPPYKKWGLRTYFSKNPVTMMAKWRELYQLRKFRKTYLQQLHLTRTTYWKSEPLKKECPPYDLLIAGSDQIWNPAMFQATRFNSMYFGSFAPPHMTKISYAASLGQGDLSNSEQEELKKFLTGFTVIGVREENAVRLLSPLAPPSCPVQQVVDPVLLLRREDYQSIFNNRKAGEAPFIFLYLLSRPTPDHLSIINDVSSQLQLPLLSLKNPDTGYGVSGTKTRILPPAQWLERLHSAAWIICSSFHAVAFALLFHKPFIYLEAEPYRRQGGNQRILSLLKPLNLEHRCLDQYHEETVKRILQESIEWKSVDMVLEERRNLSEKFLNPFLQ